jgi:hypothetical protein
MPDDALVDDEVRRPRSCSSLFYLFLGENQYCMLDRRLSPCIN